MHLNLSQPVLLVLLLAWFAKSQLSQSPNLELGFGHKILVFDAQNFTRPKRQLFREDIPGHRPLSGNHYAVMHGFPHPGRWADGSRSTFKPTANLPPPHQAYFDMLDGGRVGRYHTGFSSGLRSGGGGSSGGYYSGGGGHGFTGNELSGGGGSDYGVNGFDGGFDDDDHHAAPLPLVHQEHYGPGSENEKDPHYGAPPHVKVEVHGGYKPTYGPPHSATPEIEQPKTIVHYHPIQYSQVLNIPEGPRPQTTYGQPSPPSPTTYGPPNHVSGPPLGPPLGGIEHGGFIPNKGISNYQAPHHEEHHVPKKPIVHLHHHHHHQELGSAGGPYRFDPFKLFKQPVAAAEGPVKIPILAQFHTSKPIKFTHLKEPIHIVYRHPPGGGGPHYRPPHPHSRRPPYNFHNFHNRRPKMPHSPPQNHPDWFFSSGL